MTDTNILTIRGRLTRDAESKFTSGGLAITTFSLAVNRSIKKGESWENEASFFDVKLFGKPAEWNKDLKKGEGVILSGSLRQERWEKDGQIQSKVVIVAETVDRLAPRQAKEAAKGDGFTDDIPW